jgi:predicted RNase H-like HicB family nuclease
MNRNSDLRYQVLLYWSKEDNLFVAEVPELPGCMAHGETRQDALSSIQEAMQLWIDMALEVGNPVPEPREHGLVVT